jgi:hypothetical protein
LSRLITTFDEVPPYLSPAIHIADDDGVTFSKRVPPKSFVRSRKLKTEVSKYSRSARTPPSTFLFLHLYLSNSPGSENPNSPTRGGSGRPHSTANDNRWVSAVDSLISMRSFTGTKTCLGQEPRQCRAQWSGYKPAQSALSTPVVNKSSHRERESHTTKKSRYLRALRRT